MFGYERALKGLDSKAQGKQRAALGTWVVVNFQLTLNLFCLLIKCLPYKHQLRFNHCPHLLPHQLYVNHYPKNYYLYPLLFLNHHLVINHYQGAESFEVLASLAATSKQQGINFLHRVAHPTCLAFPSR